MTGYLFVLGPCGVCGQPFTLNADHVTSFRPQPHRSREPICADRLEGVNRQRIANGLDPIVPRPDAYQPQPGP